MSESESLGSSAPCPGAAMAFTFYNLTPGKEYTITLYEGTSFTGASSGIDALSVGMTITPTEATFTAPAEDDVAGGGDVTFTLGVAILLNEVNGSTNLSAPEAMAVNLLGGSATGQGGAFQVGGWTDLPPTCVLVNQDALDCPVCEGDASGCPQALDRGSQFYMYMQSIICCLECPDECKPLGS